MKKQWFLVAFSVLLMALLVVGCGIPQDQYDKVVAEKDSTQAELQSVKAELANSESKVSELTSNLEKGRFGPERGRDRKSFTFLSHDHWPSILVVVMCIGIILMTELYIIIIKMMPYLFLMNRNLTRIF